MTSAVVVMFVSAPFMMMMRGFCATSQGLFGGQPVPFGQEGDDGVAVHQRRRDSHGHGIDVNFRLDRHDIGAVMRGTFSTGLIALIGPFLSLRSARRRIMVHSTLSEPQCS